MKKFFYIISTVIILSWSQICLANASAFANAGEGPASASASVDSGGADTSSSASASANAQDESTATTQTSYEDNSGANVVEYIYVPYRPVSPAGMPTTDQAPSSQEGTSPKPTDEVTDADINGLLESLNAEVLGLDAKQTDIKSQIDKTEAKSVKLLNYYLVTLGGLLVIFILAVWNLGLSLRAKRLAQRAII